MKVQPTNDFLKSWQKEQSRVIIFSGVFDPVHKGHIAIAKKVQAMEGSRVIFLPERVPSHKHGSTAFNHRVNMLRIATEGLAGIEVLESPFEQHTVVETLSWVQSLFPENQHFGLLFGSDVSTYIENWNDIDRISEFGVDKLIFAERSTCDLVKTSIKGVSVVRLLSEYPHLTSTLIRQNPKERAKSLPNGVYEYIEEHNLYATGGESLR